MTLSAWRIVKPSRVRTAFDGEGARRFGGRWNSPGTRVVYAGGSLALAVLEVVVHLEGATTSLAFKAIRVEFSPALVEELPVTSLPDNWNSLPPSPDAQRLGDEWAAEGEKPVLRVPSAVVPEENNYLLNPAHLLFERIRIGGPVDFSLDSRLVGR